MTFADRLNQQWSGYADRHRNKVNLLIHIVTVPLVWIAGIQVVGSLLLMLSGLGAFKILVWAVILIAIALFAQSHGNSMEATKPAPITDWKEFALNAAAEQFVTFPRFVLTGTWLRNFQTAA
jgi:2-hydroxy-palmitic acid dioxygenase Mpo1-like protein